MQPTVPILDHAKGNAVDEWLAFFEADKFDIRKRRYETDDTYRRRVRYAAVAHQTDYRTEAWEPLEAVVEICPRGGSNRLNLAAPQYSECHYLEMKHVAVEDWLVPDSIPIRQTIGLSRRAGYIPRVGDVLLSRFKEPLGKCLIYLGVPAPLVTNTNFLLLRSRPLVSPFFVLGVFKSSFLAVQLHRIIQRRSLIAEMLQHQAPLIRFPRLPLSLQSLISEATKRRINLQAKYREHISQGREPEAPTDIGPEIEGALSQVDLFIDQTIGSFLGVSLV